MWRTTETVSLSMRKKMTNRELCEFINKYGKILYCFCIRLTGSRQEAEELYQDTLLKGTELKTKINSHDNPKAYFMGVALRLWKNRIRKENRRNIILPQEDWSDEAENSCQSQEENIESTVIRKEMKKRLREIVNQLPEELRIVTYMFYTAEMTTGQIATELHIPEGTVKSQLNRMRKIVRKGMEELGYEQYRA